MESQRGSLAAGQRSSLAAGQRSSLAAGQRSSLAAGQRSSLVADGQRASLVAGDGQRASLVAGSVNLELKSSQSEVHQERILYAAAFRVQRGRIRAVKSAVMAEVAIDEGRTKMLRRIAQDKAHEEAGPLLLGRDAHPGAATSKMSTKSAEVIFGEHEVVHLTAQRDAATFAIVLVHPNGGHADRARFLGGMVLLLRRPAQTLTAYELEALVREHEREGAVGTAAARSQETQKIAAVQAQVDSVIEVAKDAARQAVVNAETGARLVVKTDDLLAKSSDFNKAATKLRFRMRWPCLTFLCCNWCCCAKESDTANGVQLKGVKGPS
jgi:hypothetical protein